MQLYVIKDFKLQLDIPFQMVHNLENMTYI